MALWLGFWSESGQEAIWVKIWLKFHRFWSILAILRKFWTIFDIFGHFGSRGVRRVLDDGWGTPAEGSSELAGSREVRDWGSEEGSWVNFGHFGPQVTLGGPSSEIKKFLAVSLGTSQKRVRGRFFQDLDFGPFWHFWLRFHRFLRSNFTGFWVILGDFGSEGVRKGVWTDGGGTRQRAWLLGQGKIGRVWDGSRDRGLGGAWGQFWPFWGPGVKIWGSGQILVSGVKIWGARDPAGLRVQNLRVRVKIFPQGQIWGSRSRVKIWGPRSDFWSQGQNEGPDSEVPDFWGPRVKIWGVRGSDFGHFLGFFGPSPDPDRSGLRSKFPKKPGYGWGAWQVPRGSDGRWDPKLTKVVKISDILTKFCQIWRKFHRFWQFWWFWNFGWDLDGSWMTSGCLSSNSVFLDCVIREGWRDGNLGGDHFWGGEFDFWDFEISNWLEIFYRNFWLWGVISWRVSSQVQRSIFHFGHFGPFFDHWWFVLLQLDQILPTILGRSGRSILGVRQG